MLVSVASYIDVFLCGGGGGGVGEGEGMVVIG